MNPLRLLSGGLAPALAIAAVSLIPMTSCSGSAKIEGAWTETAPENVTSEFPSASDVTALRSITFMNGQQGGEGTVNLSTTYTVSKVITADSVASRDAGEIRLVASASVDGTWSVDVDDQDDILMNFDYSSISVRVNPEDVTFSNPAMKNDSLVNAEIAEVSKAVSIVFRDAASRFSTVEDVEVKNGGSVLTMELNSRHKDLTFRRVEP